MKTQTLFETWLPVPDTGARTRKLPLLTTSLSLSLVCAPGLLCSVALAGQIRENRDDGPGHQERHSQGYVFTKVAALGDPAPGPEAGTFIGDFEPYAINERGEVGFAAALSYDAVNDAAEGRFAGKPGQVRQIIRGGEAAPGGGTFGGLGIFGFLGLNNAGDISFCFGLDPFMTPLGVNAGVYRYSHKTRTLSAIVVPGETSAPGGGTFVGGDYYTGINERGDVVFTGKFSGPPCRTAPCFDGLRDGVFLASAKGGLVAVVRPGDAGPGGTVFDMAENPSINDRGDIAFDGHVTADE